MTRVAATVTKAVGEERPRTNAGAAIGGSVGAQGDVDTHPLTTYRVVEGGRRVLYVADELTDGVRELFSVLLRPSIASISPAAGRVGGNVTVTLTGEHFLPDMDVRFGGLSAPITKFVDSTRMEIRVPHLASPPPGPTTLQVPVVVVDGPIASLEPVTYAYWIPESGNDPPVKQSLP